MPIQAVKYIPGIIEKTLKERSFEFPAVALSGPRQSGKSTLIKHLFGRTHTFVSFDDPLTREQAIADPKLFIENSGNKVIFDEIQYVPQILSYIRMLIDEKRRGYGWFIVTCSQQFTLIKALGGTLAGRIALLDMLPFSMEEKRRVKVLGKKLSNTETSFAHACLRGRRI